MEVASYRVSTKSGHGVMLAGMPHGAGKHSCDPANEVEIRQYPERRRRRT